MSAKNARRGVWFDCRRVGRWVERKLDEWWRPGGVRKETAPFLMREIGLPMSRFPLKQTGEFPDMFIL